MPLAILAMGCRAAQHPPGQSKGGPCAGAHVHLQRTGPQLLPALPQPQEDLTLLSGVGQECQQMCVLGCQTAVMSMALSARAASTARQPDRVQRGTATPLGQQLPMQQAAGSRQPSSAATGTAAAAGCEPGSAAWSSALKQLLSSGGASYKWRAILPPPSGDRVGPYTSAELNGWLLQGLVPKGVGKEDARQVAAEPGSLLLCGIMATDYNAQRLPGEATKALGCCGQTCIWCAAFPKALMQFECTAACWTCSLG